MIDVLSTLGNCKKQRLAKIPDRKRFIQIEIEKQVTFSGFTLMCSCPKPEFQVTTTTVCSALLSL